MIYWIASGRRIDPDRTVPFSDQLEKVYTNPFEKKTAQPQTAAEITAHVLKRVEELLNGLDDAGGEDHPG